MNNASHNEKICTHCQQMKPLSDFVKNKRCADGYRYICKSCYNEKTREEAKRRTIKNSQESHHPNTKECSQCHKRKPLSEFPHDKTRRYGVRATCKTCTTQKRHIYLKLLERERLRQAHPPKEKKCSECHQVKPIQEFYKHTQNKDGYHTWCRECFNKRSQQLISRWENERSHQRGSIKEKLCSSCKTIKPVSFFFHRKHSKDGYHHLCKTCAKEYSKKKRRQWVEDRRRNPLQEKECIICHEILPILNFSTSKSWKDGYFPYCKKCGLQKMEEYFLKWEEERKQGHISIPRKQACYLCHRILPLSQFNKNRRKKYGVKGICKECQRIFNKKYLQNAIYRYENERALSLKLYEKECRYCSKILPASAFSKDKTTRDGLRTICKTCEKQYQKTLIARWIEERRQKQQEKVFTLFPIFEKQCSRCGRTLSNAFFTKNISRKDGLSSQCKECEQQKQRRTYRQKKRKRLAG